MSETVKTETQKKPQSKGVRVLKTVLNTIINILIVLVLITSLLIAVMALTSKASGISTIFGYTVQPIQSDSMKGKSPDGYEGGDFEKGDLMIAKATKFDPSAEYGLGDIVTFITEDSDGQQMLIVHRIIDTAENASGATVYRTQGDNREVAQVPDQNSVEDYLTSDRIGSVYHTKGYEGKIIKGVGSVFDYLRTQQGFFLVVLLPMIIFFMYELVRVVLNATNYKKAKADEEKDEAVKAAVAAALAAQQNGADAPQQAEAAAAPVEAQSDAPAMSAEELEQFRQFQEFQKMQKAQQEAQNASAEPPTAEDTPTEE